MDLYHCNIINVAKPTGRNKTVGEDKGEVALSGFTGTCYKCGEIGHTKANCPKKVVTTRGPTNTRSQGASVRSVARSKEHASPCWEDEANTHLRPSISDLQLEVSQDYWRQHCCYGSGASQHGRIVRPERHCRHPWTGSNYLCQKVCQRPKTLK
jgi:Zinc knuckle